MNHTNHGPQSGFVWKLNISTTIRLWLIQSHAHIRVYAVVWKCDNIDIEPSACVSMCWTKRMLLSTKLSTNGKCVWKPIHTEGAKPSVHIITMLCELMLCLSAQWFSNSYSYSSIATDIFTYRLKSGLDVYGAATSLIFSTMIAVMKMHITFTTVSNPEQMPQITNSTGI